MDESKSKARIIFKRRFGNARNFMTPDVIDYGMATPNLAWELSQGEGLARGSVIYGVTVLEQIWGKPTNRRLDLGKSFGSEAESRSYIETLGRGTA